MLRINSNMDEKSIVNKVKLSDLKKHADVFGGIFKEFLKDCDNQVKDDEYVNISCKSMQNLILDIETKKKLTRPTLIEYLNNPIIKKGCDFGFGLLHDALKSDEHKLVRWLIDNSEEIKGNPCRLFSILCINGRHDLIENDHKTRTKYMTSGVMSILPFVCINGHVNTYDWFIEELYPTELTSKDVVDIMTFLVESNAKLDLLKLFYNKFSNSYDNFKTTFLNTMYYPRCPIELNKNTIEWLFYEVFDETKLNFSCEMLYCILDTIVEAGDIKLMKHLKQNISNKLTLKTAIQKRSRFIAGSIIENNRTDMMDCLCVETECFDLQYLYSYVSGYLNNIKDLKSKPPTELDNIKKFLDYLFKTNSQLFKDICLYATVEAFAPHYNGKGFPYIKDLLIDEMKSNVNNTEKLIRTLLVYGNINLLDKMLTYDHLKDKFLTFTTSQYYDYAVKSKKLKVAKWVCNTTGVQVDFDSYKNAIINLPLFKNLHNSMLDCMTDSYLYYHVDNVKVDIVYLFSTNLDVISPKKIVYFLDRISEHSVMTEVAANLILELDREKLKYPDHLKAVLTKVPELETFYSNIANRRKRYYGDNDVYYY